jgi:hypothetical protein
MLPRLHPLQCHIRLFANSTLITTSFLKLPCLPSFPSQLLALPLSRSLSLLVSLSIVVLSFLLIVVLLFVIAPWWIWWLLFYCMHIQYGLYRRVVSVHLRYSTICTMLVRWFNIALCAGVTFACFAMSTHIDRFVLTFVSLFDSDSGYFLAFFFSLALYDKCNSSSFYFAFCSKKWVPFSFLVICFWWVCQLSGIQTILGHLQEVLSSPSKSNHGVNTGMVCLLVDCQVWYWSAIHTLLRAQLLCAAKEGERTLQFL